MLPVTDYRAGLSLALGILSVTCGGLFFGIPAIVVGFLARKHIERSGGAITGGGMAVGGIVTGFVGTASSLVVILALCAGMIMAPRGGGGIGSRPVAVKGTAHRATVGSVDVVQLSSAEGPMREQLLTELARARASKKVLLVQTTATWCAVCDDIDGALSDARMQTALAGVQLVRVDVDEFRAELTLQSMYEGSVPWFYRIDSSVRPTDSISGDEWDENTPANMAPVLKAFASGTFTNRRHAPPLGTPL